MTISKQASILGVALFLAVTSQATLQAQPKFYLHSNGKTVLCPHAQVGDFGLVNGVEYTKANRSMLDNNVEDILRWRANGTPEPVWQDWDDSPRFCTSGITDMSFLYYSEYGDDLDTWNADISTWDVSSVTTMKEMFVGAAAFNQDLSYWDVSSVTTMEGMFVGAYAFNSNLATWDVSAVTNMNAMFISAYDFNQPLSTWDVSAVTDMEGMFFAATAFNQPLYAWDVSAVTNMSSMFLSATAFNQDLSLWCVSSIATTPLDFSTGSGLSSANTPLWGTCPSFTLHPNGVTVLCPTAADGVTGWVNGVAYTRRTAAQIIADRSLAPTSCTSGITDMSNLFSYATFDGNISTWDVSNVLNMSYMFFNATLFNGDLSYWDVSAVTNMNGMFYEATAFNRDVSTWDVSAVTNMSRMFQSAAAFNQPLASWDVSAVTNMNYMFQSAAAFNQPLAWEVGAVTVMFGMFQGAATFNQDLSGWCVSGIVAPPSNFSTSSALISAYAPVWGACPFKRHANGVTVVCTSAADGATGRVGRFTYTRRTKAQIIADRSVSPTSCTSGITDMSTLFSYATFNGDLSTWDVSNVTNMSFMFNGATAFNQDLSSWDVSAVTDMYGMFHSAYGFNQDISTWDVSNVTTMQAMFIRAYDFNQPLSSWDVSNVTDMGGMFYAATAFNQPLASWDVSAVTDMSAMFFSAYDFNQPLASWDVSAVTNMSSMFEFASAFNQDLRLWCVSSIATTPSYFSSSSGLSSANTPVWGTCPSFTLHPNGVTVLCPTAADGVTGWVNGVAYTKRTKAQILADVSLAPTTCTSGITDMSGMFVGATIGDISTWDVSAVTNMSQMFIFAFEFNQDLSSWDVGNVTNMSQMFTEAQVFNGDISTWDVSAVTNMSAMFQSAAAFNQDISTWDVSAVTNMSSMFDDAAAFNQDLRLWCVSSIATTPTNFSTSSALISANTPVWGTCPVVQRVISGDAGWRLVSFPITGGKISDIADDTPIQGIAGGANPDAAPNVYLYDDSGVFATPADVSTPFGDGKGVAVYFFNNTAAGSAVLPVRLDAAGAPPSGDVTVTLNPTADGYTLVGNPYASNFRADATNLVFAGDGFFQNNIHFWNDRAGSYSVQDRTAYIIRPWQGFWVQRGATGGASTLTFKETGKTTSTATGAFFSKEVAQATNRADLRFTLTSERSYDEAIRLSLRDDATTGYDADDAGKLLPLLPNYAIMGFRSNDMHKSVESLPWGLTESLTIPMEQTLVGVDGGFALAWSGMESFPAGWDLTLHDYQTGVDTDMRADSSYTFDATAPAAKVSPLTLFDQLAPTLHKPASTGTRFALTVNPNTGVVSTETDNTPLEFSLDQNYPNPFNPSTTIGYTLREAGPVSLSIYTMTGQVVATLVNESQPAGQHRHSWDARGFASGVYYYRLRANGMDVTRKMTLIK